jgi:hypothetical protein
LFIYLFVYLFVCLFICFKGVGGKTDKDWVQIWRTSPEAGATRQELQERQKNAEGQVDTDIPREFATSKYALNLSFFLFFTLIFNLI